MQEQCEEDYKLFFNFIDRYTPERFTGIDPADPLMVELNRMMNQNDQFIYVGDAIEMKIIYTSSRSTEMIGIPPRDISLKSFMELVHPEDIQRLSNGRSKIIKFAQDLFIAKKGNLLVSANFRLRNAAGKYSNFLFQCYLFYSEIPHSSVYLLKVHTNIDWFKNPDGGYHYYTGNDLSFFRYPDEELLLTGNIFTDREFEIIRMIQSGLRSEQIAEKLFLSIHTVNTHRKNILAKSGKANASELIHDLIVRGLL